jgi:hypothetical protein
MIKKYYHSDMLVVILFIIQGMFWYETNHIKPEMTIVPNVPSEATVQALSFGDEEFFFRALALDLQNMGDTFGRFTALKYYNYKKLYGWFLLMDTLNSTSDFVPSIASYYFSQTQNKPDVRYIVDYLDQHANRDINKNWWWMTQAVYLSNHVLHDKDRALQLAYSLARARGTNVPIWAQQMPAFIHEQRNEKEEALIIIRDLLKNEAQLAPSEKAFMNYFINERLNTIIHDAPLAK